MLASPETTLKGRDFGIKENIKIKDVRDIQVPVAGTEVSLHAYVSENKEPGADNLPDAVCISGFATGAHDLLPVLPLVKDKHRNIGFFSHPEGPDSSMKDPTRLLNQKDFANSGPALLRSLE